MRAPFTSEQVRVLTRLLDHCAGERVILIGAGALGCHVPMTWRRTHDLDLTILADMESAETALRAAGLVRDPKVEHRWLAQGVRLDVLPATEQDIERRQLVWPSGQIMSLVGFDLAYEHTLPVPLNASCVIRVPTLPVLVVLKMVSWLDAPHERERDLSDLGYILSEYLDDDAMRHWTIRGLLPSSSTSIRLSPLATTSRRSRELTTGSVSWRFSTPSPTRGPSRFSNWPPMVASAMWTARLRSQLGSSGCGKVWSSTREHIGGQ